MFYELAGDWPSDAGCHVHFIFLILENRGRTNKEFYRSKLSQRLDNFLLLTTKMAGHAHNCMGQHGHRLP